MKRLRQNSMHESMSLKRSLQTKKNAGMYRFNVERRLRPRRFKPLQSKLVLQQVVREALKAMAISVTALSIWSITRQVTQRI